MRSRCGLIGGIVLVLATTPPALAQEPGPADDPAQQLRDLQRERERLEERERLPIDEPRIEVPDVLAPDLEDEEVEFFLAEVRFSTSEFLDDEWLRELAGEYVGRVVGFGELNEMVGRINDRYSEKGLVTARAFIPPQQIEQGALDVLLVEGRLGAVEIEGAERTSHDYIRRRIPLETGEVVRMPALQSSLQDFNRRESIRAGAALQPGDDFGESDIILQIQEPPALSYQLFADNAGSRNTGENRVGGFLSWFSPFGRSDRVTTFLAGSSGTAAIDMNYTTPVGYDGASLNARVAYNETEIVRGPLKDIDVEGDSVRASTRYVHPWHRTDRRTWDVTGDLGYVRSRTDLEGVTFADSEVWKLTAGLRVRDYAPPGMFGYFVEVDQGLGYARFRDQAGEVDATDNALMWQGNLLWEQRFSETVYSVVRGEWQYTPKPEAVLSPELFQLGGAFDVRGYPQAVSAGERGYFASAELRYAGTETVQPFAFIDHGAVRLEDQRNESLTGVGGGAFREFNGGFSASMTVGFATTEIVPDQDNYQVHLRLAWRGSR